MVTDQWYGMKIDATDYLHIRIPNDDAKLTPYCFIFFPSHKGQENVWLLFQFPQHKMMMVIIPLHKGTTQGTCVTQRIGFCYKLLV